MVQKYFINFWIWWYFIELKEIGRNLFRTWLYIVGYTNVVPMATNLFTPLYQDFTAIGYFLGFIIRSIWTLIGSVIVFLAAIPILLVFLLFLVLPLVPIFMIFSYIFA